MPSCIKCGQDNAGGTRFCQKCGAMLPQMAPSGMPTGGSSLDLDEDTEYLTPQYRYFSEVMHHLSWSAHDFLEEGAPLGPFLEAFEEVKTNFHRFVDTDLPLLMDSMVEQKQERPNDPVPRQLAYLNTKGVNLYEEGLASIESFLAGLKDEDSEEGPNPDLLIDGITRVLDGNDHFCLCIEICQSRIDAIKEYIAKGMQGEGAVPDLELEEEEEGEAAAPAPARPGAKPAAKPKQEEPEPVGSATEDDGLA